MPAKGVGPIQEIIEVPTTPPLTIIVNGLGGSINAHVALFWRIKAQGGPVKVIGPCGSACTQVLSFIPKDRLCFGERSFLAFHMVRKANVPNVEETRLMINSYQGLDQRQGRPLGDAGTERLLATRGQGVVEDGTRKM